MGKVQLGMYFKQATIGSEEKKFQMPKGPSGSGGLMTGSRFFKVITDAKLFRDSDGILSDIRSKLGIDSGNSVREKPLLNRAIKSVGEIIVNHFNSSKKNDLSLAFLRNCAKSSDGKKSESFSEEDVRTLEEALTADEKHELRRVLVEHDFDFESCGDMYEFVKYKLQKLNEYNNMRKDYGTILDTTAEHKDNAFQRFAQGILSAKGERHVCSEDLDILKSAVARLAQEKLANGRVIVYVKPGDEDVDRLEFMEACYEEMTSRKTDLRNRMTTLRQSYEKRVDDLLQAHVGTDDKRTLNAIAFRLVDVNASLDGIRDRLLGAAVKLPSEELPAEFDRIGYDFTQILDTLLPAAFPSEVDAKPLTAEGAKVQADVHLEKFAQNLMVSIGEQVKFEEGDTASIKKGLTEYGKGLFDDILKAEGEQIRPNLLGLSLPGVMQKMRTCLSEVFAAYSNEPEYAKELGLDTVSTPAFEGNSSLADVANGDEKANAGKLSEGKDRLVGHCRTAYRKSRSKLLETPEFYKNPGQEAKSAFKRDVRPRELDCKNFACGIYNKFAEDSWRVCNDLLTEMKNLCTQRGVNMSEEDLAEWAGPVAKMRAQYACELFDFAIKEYLQSDKTEDLTSLLQQKQEELLKGMKDRKEEVKSAPDFFCRVIFREYRKAFGEEIGKKALTQMLNMSPGCEKLAKMLYDKSSKLWDELKFASNDVLGEIQKLVNDRFAAYEKDFADRIKKGDGPIGMEDFKSFVSSLKDEVEKRIEGRSKAFQDVLGKLFTDIESRNFPGKEVPLLSLLDSTEANTANTCCKELQKMLLSALKKAKGDILVCGDGELQDKVKKIAGDLKKALDEGVKAYNKGLATLGEGVALGKLQDIRLNRAISQALTSKTYTNKFVEIRTLAGNDDLREGLKSVIGQWGDDSSRCHSTSELREIVEQTLSRLETVQTDMIKLCTDWLKANVDHELLMNEQSAAKLKSGEAGENITISPVPVLGDGENQADLFYQIVGAATQDLFRNPQGFDPKRTFEEKCKPLIKAAAEKKSNALSVKYLEDLKKNFLVSDFAMRIFARKMDILDKFEKDFGVKASRGIENVITMSLGAIALSHLDKLTVKDLDTERNFIPSGQESGSKEVSVDRFVVTSDSSSVKNQENAAKEACDQFTTDLMAFFKKARGQFVQTVGKINPDLVAIWNWQPTKDAFARLEAQLMDYVQTSLAKQPDFLDGLSGRIDSTKIDLSPLDKHLLTEDFRKMVDHVGNSVEKKRLELLKRFDEKVDNVFDGQFRKGENAKRYRSALGAGGLDELRRNLGRNLASLRQDIKDHKVELNKVESRIGDFCKNLASRVDAAVLVFEDVKGSNGNTKNLFGKVNNFFNSTPKLEDSIRLCRIRAMLPNFIAGTAGIEEMAEKIRVFAAGVKGDEGLIGSDLKALGREVLLKDGTVAEAPGDVLDKNTNQKNLNAFFQLLLDPSGALKKLVVGKVAPEDLDCCRFEVTPENDGLTVQITPSPTARHGRQFNLVVKIANGKFTVDPCSTNSFKVKAFDDLMAPLVTVEKLMRNLTPVQRMDAVRMFQVLFSSKKAYHELVPHAVGYMPDILDDLRKSAKKGGELDSSAILKRIGSLERRLQDDICKYHGNLNGDDVDKVQCKVLELCRAGLKAEAAVRLRKDPKLALDASMFTIVPELGQSAWLMRSETPEELRKNAEEAFMLDLGRHGEGGSSTITIWDKTVVKDMGKAGAPKEVLANVTQALKEKKIVSEAQVTAALSVASQISGASLMPFGGIAGPRDYEFTADKDGRIKVVVRFKTNGESNAVPWVVSGLIERDGTSRVTQFSRADSESGNVVKFT